MAFPREPHILFFVTPLRSWKSFWLCKGYAPGGRHFWGFLLFRPALLGISSFPPGTLGISTLPPAGRKRTLSNASTVVKNQTFEECLCFFVAPAPKVWFSTTVEAFESVRPAGGKVEIPKVPGGKEEIPKSAGRFPKTQCRDKK
ncbi:Uncharacterized protein FWK35_00027564 [Aphis craccivora]|uniref:Uncharacterized protein n=1 Tax=Aphis craccivora TaxID=307492 RepID=A0A6G0XEI6_APHCR|nr:Uncharacterized protein FWK35_00027564 [Aphis craccivora]